MSRIDKYLKEELMAHPANYINGWDLPFGFESFDAALLTLDPDKMPWKSHWKIRNKIYVLEQIFAQPLFIPLEMIV